MDHSQSDPHGGMSEGLHETADTARNIAHTLERSADALDKAGKKANAVGQRVDRFAGMAEKAGDTLASNARRHPMAAVAVALAVGFLVGSTRD